MRRKRRNLRNEWHLEEGSTERCTRMHEQILSSRCQRHEVSSGPVAANACVYTNSHVRECEFVERERDQPRIGRISLAGRYKPYALIETPTPSLCGYRKHSRWTRDLSYANIIDLPSSLPLAILSRTAVCTRSRKTAVCVGPKGACFFSVSVSRILILSLLCDRCDFFLLGIIYHIVVYK